MAEGRLRFGDLPVGCTLVPRDSDDKASCWLLLSRNGRIFTWLNLESGSSYAGEQSTTDPVSTERWEVIKPKEGG